MFFDSWFGIFRVVAVSLAAYSALVLVLRIAGKRSLAKLNAFDLVVTVALGSTLATVLLSKDVAFAEGALAFALLAGLQWTVARASVRWKWFEQLVRSEPTLLVDNGRYLRESMRSERVTQAEIEQAIRKGGIGRIEQVAAVILETDGSFSVIAGDGPAGKMSAVQSVRGARPPVDK